MVLGNLCLFLWLLGENPKRNGDADSWTGLRVMINASLIAAQRPSIDRNAQGIWEKEQYTANDQDLTALSVWSLFSNKFCIPAARKVLPVATI